MKKSLCIFCKSNKNPFTSIEHIFPESIGNKQFILPKGVVCDVCNNGVLAQLDQIIVESPSVATLKQFYCIPNKSGKYTTTKLTNLKIKPDSNTHVTIHISHKKFITFAGNTIKLRGVSPPFSKKFYCNLMRAFYKILLEAIHFDHGYGLSLDKSYDKIRNRILCNKPFHGFFIMETHVTPKRIVEIKYKFKYISDGRLTLCKINLFGMSYYFCPEEDDFKMPDDLKNYSGLKLIKL
jgi:hypothetical protein